MTFGTSYFISKSAAIRYYRVYEGKYAEQVVEQKLKNGEIHLGEPPIVRGESLRVNDEGRYEILS